MTNVESRTGYLSLSSFFSAPCPLSGCARPPLISLSVCNNNCTVSKKKMSLFGTTPPTAAAVAAATAAGVVGAAVAAKIVSTWRYNSGRVDPRYE